MWWEYPILGAVFALGVLLAFPLAVAICTCLGWMLVTIDRLTTRCPTCGVRRMRLTNGSRETYPSGRGTGRFYLCEACRRRWFWSNDDWAWQNASDRDFEWAYGEGRESRGGTSVLEQELPVIEQRPQHVFQCPPPVRGVRDPSGHSPPFFCAWVAA